MTKQVPIIVLLCALSASARRAPVAAVDTTALSSGAVADINTSNATLIDIRTYGAKVDGKAVGDGYGAWSRVRSDCSMISESAVLSCASDHFVATDVGKVIAVYGAGPTNNAYVQPLSTTISSYISGTSVTLAATASNSVTNSERVVWGTNDTTADQAAITAACKGGGGTVYVPSGTSLTTGVTLSCAKVGIKGEGRNVSALENWNINSGTTLLVTVSVSGTGPASVGGIYLGHMELRQVENPTNVLQVYYMNQTFKSLVEDLRVIGYSYECAINGGASSNYGDEIRNSELGPCGNGGPTYTSSTSAINYNGDHIWSHDNRVSMSGQAEEYGGRGGRIENNYFDGTTLSGGHQGLCVNLGSTGGGVFDVWVLNNTCVNFLEGIGGKNGIGTMNRIHIEGNKLIDSGGIGISGGLDSNSYGCSTGGYNSPYCQNDTVIHGVSTIRDNTLISNTIPASITVDSTTSLPPSVGLESIDIEGNLHQVNYDWRNAHVGHIDIAGVNYVWVPSTAYTADSNGYVYPMVLNGYVYHASVAGTTGTTEPAWPLTVGGTVIDGGVTWTNAGTQPQVRVKNETLVQPPGVPSGGYDITFDYKSREMVSISNVSANYQWQIYHRVSNGRGLLTTPSATVEFVPANTPYSDSDRYYTALPSAVSCYAINGRADGCGPATYFPLGTRIWSVTPTGGSTGRIVTTAGWNASTWAAANPYSNDSYIQAPTDNGHFYRNLAACTTNSTPPTFPTGAGATVMDNTCTWKESGPDAAFSPFSGARPPN